MRVSKEYSIEASHILPNHPGRCSSLHGHSYLVVVEVEGDVLAVDSFVVDYWDIDVAVKPIVDMLDHKHLNLFITYPSAENIAAFIAHEIRPKLLVAGGGPRIIRSLRVSVSETAKTWAVWCSTVIYDVLRLDGPREMGITKGVDMDGWRSPDVSIQVDIELRKAETEEALEAAKEGLDLYTRAMTKVAQNQRYDESLMPLRVA